VQQVPMAAAPREATSPWAQNMQRAASAPAGPTVVQHDEPMRAAVGQPLVLGNQAPPPGSFTISERVRETLRRQQNQPAHQTQYRLQPPPAAAPVPMQQNPYGLLPPGRIPNARTGADPMVTGSIPRETKSKSEPKKGAASAPTSSASLMSSQSLAEQASSSEPASVFNLLPPGNR
jgi:hypothetical protein